MAAKYILIANELRTFITDNNNRRIKLPTEQELSRRYQVSRQTIRKALSILEEEMLITKKQGSGSYSAKVDSTTSKKEVALILNSDSEYIYPGLINDIKSHLLLKGYSLSVYSTNNNLENERNILLFLLRSSISGIIVEGVQNTYPSPNADIYNNIRNKGINILFIDGCYPNLEGFSNITCDNYHASLTLCQHLIDNNHSSIAAIFQSDTISGIDKYHGYIDALRNNHIPMSSSNVLWFNYEDLNNLEKKQDTYFLERFISKKLVSCSGVICQNDEIAYWLTKELIKANYYIPEDISIVCFNNTYLNDIGDKSITTMAYKPHEFGTIISDRFVSLTQGHSSFNYYLPLKMIDRKSVSIYK